MFALMLTYKTKWPGRKPPPQTVQAQHRRLPKKKDTLDDIRRQQCQPEHGTDDSETTPSPYQSTRSNRYDAVS